ncbi:MAG: hypothetical protein H7X80_08745 [bacterium]|nr:hypothetical protein [Candidatus Kapabacteria bacterium]
MIKRLWFIVLGLFIVNMIIALAMPVDIIQADGSPGTISRWSNVSNLAIMLAFWMTFTSVLVAALGALVPHRGLEYSKRYPLAFVITLAASYVFWLVVGVIRLIGGGAR